MLAVLLNLAGRRAVVVGGGPVGRRKAAAVRAAGAAVRVVDPAPRPADLTDPDLEWIHEPYRAGHLDGADLAFAAAAPDVNAAVVADARARGLWVNSATDPDAGDFLLPATLSVGELTVAVSTGGAAPALARRIRDRLAGDFDQAYADWLRVLAAVRAEVLRAVPDERARRALLEQFSDWPWLERVRRDGPDAALAAMADEVRRAQG